MKGYVVLKKGGYVLKEFEAQVAKASPETILREGRQRKLSLVQLPGTRVYVKTFFDDAGLLGTIVRRGRYRARREFRNLVKAFEVGVPVPRPIALIEAKDGGAVWTEELAGMETLRDVFERPLNFSTRGALLSGLGKFLHHVHDLGFYHEDMHAGNILVKDSRFAVVDMAGVSFAGRPLSKARRIESLTVVLTSFQIDLNMTDYVRVLRAYGIDERSVWDTIARRLVELRARFVENRAKKAAGAGSTFSRRKLGRWDVLAHQDIDPEPILPRLGEVQSWASVGDDLVARYFPDPDHARRWWVQSWKLKYNLVPAPLGVVWLRGSKGSTVVARVDPRWLAVAPQPSTTFLGDLGRFLRRLHDLGTTVPNLRIDDLLHFQAGPEYFRFALADPSRAECVVDLTTKDRAWELGSLVASMSGVDERCMVKAYAAWSREYLRDSFLLAVRNAGLKHQSERKQKRG